MTSRAPCIWVLAGTNGAGKSSIGGAMLRRSGGTYYNPDEAASVLRARDPTLSQAAANGLAWRIGLRQLDQAIKAKKNYFFETTLGGRTIASRLERAARDGFVVRVWYVGLGSPELHIRRVRERVQAGGHDIPEAAIRRRFDASRRNLIRLLPVLAELKVHDNSAAVSLPDGEPPMPELLLHFRAGQIVAPADFRATPDWAKPIVAMALKLARTGA